MSEPIDLQDCESTLDSEALRRAAEIIIFERQFALAMQVHKPRMAVDRPCTGHLSVWVMEDHPSVTNPQYTRETILTRPLDKAQELLAKVAREDEKAIARLINSNDG
jgi:hypothetical protein